MPEENIPAHLSVYRDPLSPWPCTDTYTLHVSELCQMQWDYMLDWENGKPPKLWICSYRCFQKWEASAEWKMTDQLPFNVPVRDEVLWGIAQQAAAKMYAGFQVLGDLLKMPQAFIAGAAEAAGKRFEMGQYRKMITASCAKTNCDSHKGQELTGQ